MKDLAAKFSEVERRVRKLVEENRSLRGQVGELEKQLAEARHDAQGLEHMQGNAAKVREKLERVLKKLETLGTAVDEKETADNG